MVLEWIERVVDVSGTDGPENFKILNKLELRFDRRSARLGFSDLIKSDQFGFRPVEMSWDLRFHKMRHACGRVST